MLLVISVASTAWLKSEYMQDLGGESYESPIMIPPLQLLILIFPVWVAMILQESSLFLIKHYNRTYTCALVHWFSKIGEEPYVNTGMWWVKHDFDAEGGIVICQTVLTV